MPFAPLFTCIGVPPAIFTKKLNEPVVALVIQYCCTVAGMMTYRSLVSVPTNLYAMRFSSDPASV